MRAIPITKAVLIIIGFAVLTTYPGQWEVFTSKNDVRDIALTGNTLWAATTGGVVKWNLVDNSYKSYTTADGLWSCNAIQTAIDKEGRPWVATKDPCGLFVYKNYVWEQINVGGAENEIAGKVISDLEVDQFGNIWVSTRPKKMSRPLNLWRYDGRIWYKHEYLYALTLDLQNNLLAVDSLFSTENNDTLRFRIASFNGSEFVSKLYSSNKYHEAVYMPALAHIAQDSKGNIWFSNFDERFSDTHGVVCNDTIYNTLDGLADDNFSGGDHIAIYNDLQWIMIH